MFWRLFFKYFYYFMSVCLHVLCVPCVYLVLMEVKRGSWIHQDWGYRQLCTSMWVLGMKPRSSSRAVRLLATVPIVLLHFLIVFLYMGVFPACTAVHHSWCPRRPEKGAGGPGTGATDNYRLKCRCWEFNLGPQEEQLVLLTDESSC